MKSAMKKDEANQLFSMFPKSNAIIPTCQAAHSFFMLLVQRQNPISVMDEMMVYYEKVIKDQQDLLMKYIMRNGPLPIEDLCQK